MLKELTSLGLNEKEAKIYATLLELGTTTVAEIASKSKLKRPTVYLHIDEMAQKGVVEKVRLNNKILYKPTDPSFFDERVSETEKAVQAIKEAYDIGQLHTGKPRIQIFEGIENVRKIYSEIAEENSMRFWSNVQGLNPIFHKEWEHMSEKFQENETTVREIIADNKEVRRISKYYKGIIGSTYSARVATVDGLQNDGAVSSKALYIFRLHEFNSYAVKIEDATIASTYRALFDMAWKTAKPV